METPAENIRIIEVGYMIYFSAPYSIVCIRQVSSHPHPLISKSANRSRPTATTKPAFSVYNRGAHPGRWNAAVGTAT